MTLKHKAVLKRMILIHSSLHDRRTDMIIDINVISNFFSHKFRSSDLRRQKYRHANNNLKKYFFDVRRFHLVIRC